MHDRIPSKGMCSGSREPQLFKCWEMIDDISEIVQDRDIVTMED